MVQYHLQHGDTYLLNLTMPTPINTNLRLETIFEHSKAPYRLLIADEMVCFSPEIFVRIQEGIISSYPMKGTIKSDMPNAADMLLQDPKELAEHNTIVDLIRNDLSIVAKKVRVKRYRYLDEIHTNRGGLLQMSSEIAGVLPPDYPAHIGNILAALLPAGSISGAPKEKTVSVIQAAEVGPRGYYTGVFGVFDGKNMDSAVMIRFIEAQNKRYVYRSGGGITAKSQCKQEYQELINKVYVPIGKHTD
ncbi:MAG: aminodeoxychorismate synthase component I [Bacteroidia bacterium]|nr:MAG: aminodeoxychorismate synthase component I [Bacteroidia bacterium]